MPIPKDINDLIKRLIEYQKSIKSSKSVNQTALDMGADRIYLKGFYDGLYIAGLAEKVVDEPQFNSYKIDIEKTEKILNER